MKVGDKIKVIHKDSRFLGQTAEIEALVSIGFTEALFFIVFDDKSITLYKGLHFLESELEVIEDEN